MSLQKPWFLQRGQSICLAACDGFCFVGACCYERAPYIYSFAECGCCSGMNLRGRAWVGRKTTIQNQVRFFNSSLPGDVQESVRSLRIPDALSMSCDFMEQKNKHDNLHV